MTILSLVLSAGLVTMTPNPPASPDAPGRSIPERPIDTTGAELAAASDPAADPLRWAQGAVWYQVFPERFRNGNPLNDPRDPGTFLARWNSDWYASDPIEKQSWLARQFDPKTPPPREERNQERYYWIFDRRYGGDLQGVVEKLDHLRSIGVTAIYLNPIFQAQSLHKYDASDFRHIDANLAWPAEAGAPPAVWEPDPEETKDPKTWKWTPADRYFIDVFLPACRAKGIRVIIDGVWNHSGRPFWAFQDVVRNGKDSRYADWFYCRFDANGNLIGWRAWDQNNGWLPKFRQTDDGDLHPEIKDHLFNVTRRWMDPNGDGDPSDGIDGWRLDVALDLGAPFWRDWYALVKSINPAAITIGEIWDRMAKFPQGKYFDTQMHYPFAYPVLDWLGVRPGMKVADLHRRLDEAFGDKPFERRLIAQNLFASHDTDRYVSMLFNPGREYDQRNSILRGEMYNAGKPPMEYFERSILGVAIQATYIGAPMIYYGDELGMWGADDPDCRKAAPWADLPPNDNPEDRAMPEMTAAYAKWFNLRQDPELGPILRFGNVRHLDAGTDDVFAFEREYQGRRAVVAVNRGDESFDAARLGVASDSVVEPRSARVWLLP